MKCDLIKNRREEEFIILGQEKEARKTTELCEKYFEFCGTFRTPKVADEFEDWCIEQKLIVDSSNGNNPEYWVKLKSLAFSEHWDTFIKEKTS